MSHFKERAEKNCLNCNTEIHGRYCHVCGQENVEPKETAWHLVTHFFNDITHFDGKFFSTLKYLITKPGFVSKEYMIGRRASYLNPVRMYVFTSAIFFLIFFSVNHFDADHIKTTVNDRTIDEIAKMDSTEFSIFTKRLNKGNPMSREDFAKYLDTSRKKGTFTVISRNYKSKAAYDSLLKTGQIKDNWFERKLVYKQIELNDKYQRDGNKIMAVFINALMHSFPQMLFISLPIFALVLQLLYVRRKNYYYANHAIFSVHLYVFVFIVLLLIMGLAGIRNYMHWNWINLFIAFCVGYIFFYQYKAMRKFYMQRRAKTVFKFLLLNLAMFFVIGLLFIVFSLFSLLKI